LITEEQALMAKIMLVEDDNNLREIYEARLLAEGYEIVAAQDGEQALALAVKEKPDLIIADIMMPKISGFDMLDILRSTPETKNTKVIMMTALSQAEDKARADKLGADRYLVKSQVTLEDVAKVAREVLQDEDTVPAAQAVPPTPAAPTTTPSAIPVAAPPSEPTTQPPAAAPQSTATPAQPAPPPVQSAPPPPQSAVPPATPPSTSVPAASTTAQEEATLKNKIDSFVKQPGTAQPAPRAMLPRENIPTRGHSPASATVAADATNAAASNAASMVNAANDLLKKPAVITPDISADKLSPNQIAGKKVIKPISDITPAKPSLNDLLAKETQAVPVAPPPTTSVVAPGGETVTPPAPDQKPSDKQAGNVVQPGSSDPNSIAL
jgi:CheY-like chemotaxis protein